MKTNFLKTALLILVLSNFSCSDDDEQPQAVTPVATNTSFKLDGVLITPDEVTATLYNNTVAGGQYIDVYASKDGVQVLELHFPAATGTYPAQQSFDMTSSWLTYEANGGADYPADYYHSTSGSIILTTVDLTNDKLNGTFSFVGNNTSADKTITEGVLVVTEITHQ